MTEEPHATHQRAELIARAFVRHVHGQRRATRDLRYLTELLQDFDVLMKSAGGAHADAQEDLRRRLKRVRAARKAALSDPVEHRAMMTIRRVRRLRHQVLQPQPIVTRRPALIEMIAAHAGDVAALAGVAGDLRLQWEANETIDVMGMQRERALEARAGLDRDAFGQAMLLEFEDAVRGAEARALDPEARPRHRRLALDRVFEAYRQMDTCVPEPTLVRVGERAVALSRALGPGVRGRALALVPSV